MHTREEKLEAVGRLLDIMDKLRAECPWNGAQTQDSLRQLTLEEVFELSDAVLSHKDSDIEKELGDLLLHIVFYAKIAEENGLYDIADIASRECEKMVFRHPHVFSGEKEADAQSVSEHWELRKLKERAGKHILDGVPESAPSVLKAMQIQRKVRDVGFDWEDRSDVWAKVREEMAEFEAEARALAEAEEAGAAVASTKDATTPAEPAAADGTAHDFADGAPAADRATAASSPAVAPTEGAPAQAKTAGAEERLAAARDRAESELGDVLFATINAARLYGIDPEVALSRTCRKFRRRFDYLEDRTIRAGRLLRDLSLAEMDAIWDEAKAEGL